MTWFVRTLVSAMVAGVGWKLGADLYDTAKRTIRDRAAARAEGDDADEAVENGAAATETDVVDVSEQPSTTTYRWT